MGPLEIGGHSGEEAQVERAVRGEIELARGGASARDGELRVRPDELQPLELHATAAHGEHRRPVGVDLQLGVAQLQLVEPDPRACGVERLELALGGRLSLDPRLERSARAARHESRHVLEREVGTSAERDPALERGLPLEPNPVGPAGHDELLLLHGPRRLHRPERHAAQRHAIAVRGEADVGVLERAAERRGAAGGAGPLAARQPRIAQRHAREGDVEVPRERRREARPSRHAHDARAAPDLRPLGAGLGALRVGPRQARGVEGTAGERPRRHPGVEGAVEEAGRTAPGARHLDLAVEHVAESARPRQPVLHRVEQVLHAALRVEAGRADVGGARLEVDDALAVPARLAVDALRVAHVDEEARPVFEIAARVPERDVEEPEPFDARPPRRPRIPVGGGRHGGIELGEAAHRDLRHLAEHVEIHLPAPADLVAPLEREARRRVDDRGPAAGGHARAVERDELVGDPDRRLEPTALHLQHRRDARLHGLPGAGVRAQLAEIAGDRAGEPQRGQHRSADAPLRVELHRHP